MRAAPTPRSSRIHRPSSPAKPRVREGRGARWPSNHDCPYGHRHRSFRHTSTTGRPPAGKHLHHGLPPSFDAARPPQPSHQARTAVVSTAASTSPSFSTVPARRNPSNPSRPVSSSLTSATVCGLLPSRLSPAQCREATDTPPAFPASPALPNQTPSPLQRVEPVSILFCE